MLGLSYKVGTDTLRRSPSMELIDRLLKLGTKISAFDPKVSSLPQKYSGMLELSPNIDTAIKDSTAIVIATAWPEFKALSKEQLDKYAPNAFVLDQERLLDGKCAKMLGDKYLTVGKPK